MTSCIIGMFAYFNPRTHEECDKTPIALEALS